jgi:hypothetical protein
MEDHLKAKANLSEGIAHIALSFSGGGYRAAAFTLGCTAYLNELDYQGKPMLGKVRYISSVSGGSITAIALFSLLRKGWSFARIYNHLLSGMQGTRLIDYVLKIFNDDQHWLERPLKTRNLINAFAIAYDKLLFEEETFGSFFHQPTPPAGMVIDELCVNATEFHNGMNFRFSTHQRLGNQFLHLQRGSAEKRHILDKMKLGDIMACSSCFPVGFEPMMFPCDFTYDSPAGNLDHQSLGGLVQTKDYYSGEFKPIPVSGQMFGLMDGGIDDNQGIYSFMKADDRKANSYAYDLYLPCDVSSNFIEKPFVYPGDTTFLFSEINIPTLLSEADNYLTIATGLSLVLAIGSLTMLQLSDFTKTWSIIFGVSFFAFLLCLPILLGLSWCSRKLSQINAIPKNDSSWDRAKRGYLSAILKLPIRRLVPLILARFNSVFLLSTAIFLKKIRRASYNQLFKSAERPNDQTMMTAVYLLATKNNKKFQELVKSDLQRVNSSVTGNAETVLLRDFLQPSATLRAHIDRAAAMETKLWFKDFDMQQNVSESLLIAGQATMCFNLLRMAHKIDSPHSSWPELREALTAHWIAFNADPSWLSSKLAPGIA